MPGRPTAIPVGTQFSPALIDLRAFLAAATVHSGDKEALMEAAWTAPVRLQPPANPPTKRRRSLPLEAAVQYGLLAPKTYTVTPLALDLAKLSKPAALYETFARHIVLNLGGLRVIEAAQQMKLDSLLITGDTLAEYLTDQGFPVTIHNTAINSLRMWLERAGVFGIGTWDVDTDRKRDILGLDDDTIAALVAFTPEQRAFVLALCRINPKGDYPAAEVRMLAEQIVGHRFGRGSLPNAALKALSSAGLIEFITKGTEAGKTSILRLTPQFRKEVMEPFVENTVRTLDAVLTAYYRKPPEQIYSELESTDKFVKGKALEAYAVHIMRLLGLRFVGWRKQAPETTAQAEVDVIMTGLIGGLPSRWQIQCKNTPKDQVNLEDVAKEVGLLPVTKASHIMILANGGFTRDAERYAFEVMRHTSVFIFLLGADDFERVHEHPGELPLILRSKAEAIADLRRGSTMWDI